MSNHSSFSSRAKSPTIAYFVHNLDGYSGAAAQAALLARHVTARVIFFNLPHHHSDRPYPEDLEVLTLPNSFIAQLAFILWHTLRNRVTTFHFHGLFNAGILAARLLRRRAILKTTLIGDDDIVTLRNQRTWVLRRCLLRGITFNICLTKQIAERNRSFFPSSKIKIIPNGVLIPEKLSIKEPLSFCFVGVVCERKNTKASIEYFRTHYSHIQGAKLYIVGPFGTSELSKEATVGYVEQCKKLADDPQLHGKVSFTGAVDRRTALEIMQRCYGLLFFSEAEGMPNVVIEALSCNCVPIVGPMQGTAKEMIDDGVNGFLISNPADNIQIDRIFRSVHEQRPYLKARSHYRIDLISQAYDQIYG